MKNDGEKLEVYLISDLSKILGVQSHVLRYWEEEMGFNIERNPMGHRRYSKDDLERFMKIQELKKQGMQLKEIRTYFTDDYNSADLTKDLTNLPKLRTDDHQENALSNHETNNNDKAKRLSLLLRNLVNDAVKTAVKENNQEMVEELKSAMAKEIDFQFREREQAQIMGWKKQQDFMSEHFEKIDEILRQKQVAFRFRRAGGREMTAVLNSEKANNVSDNEQSQNLGHSSPGKSLKRKGLGVLFFKRA